MTFCWDRDIAALPENTVGNKRVERCEGPFLDGPMDKATAEEKAWVCQLEANSGAWHMLGRGRHSSIRRHTKTMYLSTWPTPCQGETVWARESVLDG